MGCSSAERMSFHSVVTAYLAVLLVLSALVGLARSLARFSAEALPDQYLAHSVLMNAAMMWAFGLVSLILVLAVRTKSRTKRSTPEITGLLFTYFLFWGFNTAMGFRVMREFMDGKTEPVFSEVLQWAPGFLIVGALGWWLIAKLDLRRVYVRCAVVGVPLALAVLGLRIYSSYVNPSTKQYLEIEASAHQRPHVFLVLVDTLRADHLQTYGYSKPTSPNVERFAADAIVYERAFSQAPWTRPSCGSLLTARFPHEIGLDGIFNPLADDAHILPQFMRAEGYRTAGIVANIQLSPQFGFDKGFDLLDIGTTYLHWTGLHKALSRLGLTDYRDIYPRYNASQLTNRALDWIDEQLDEDDSSPLFMYLHYTDPHAPYRPPQAHDRWREFAGEQAREIEEPPFSPTWEGHLTGVRAEALVARYDAEIAYFDSQFKRFVDELKRLGIYEQSLIIFTADHGEEFAEHGGWAHGHSLYNELLHVPLIFKYPNGLYAENRPRVETIVALVDVIPTIRDVLGAAWPEKGFRGRSLLQLPVDGQGGAVFARNASPSLRAFYRGEDKLIQRVDPQGEVVGEEYYSLVRNFAETGEGTSTDEHVERRLDEMRKIIASIDALAIQSEEVDVDESTLEELRALGYIQ
ncbi:MAG: sulfatase [bacterium]|nr:sulfatase [bacterium]